MTLWLVPDKPKIASGITDCSAEGPVRSLPARLGADVFLVVEPDGGVEVEDAAHEVAHALHPSGGKGAHPAREAGAKVGVVRQRPALRPWPDEAAQGLLVRALLLAHAPQQAMLDEE